MIAERVRKAVDAAPVVDLHTHLFPPAFGDLCLAGPDELLTYHYLVAETLRFSDEAPEAFFARTKAGQADHVWQTLFVERAPVSEAAASVAATFAALGAKDLMEAREALAALPIGDRIERIFGLAGVAAVTMTNDPLNADELVVYEAGFAGDDRFRTALRIDPVVLEERGTTAWTRRYVAEWSERLRASYVAVSLPPDLDLTSDADAVRRLRESVLPILRERNLPLALMIGVRRAVNPRLGLAGDASGVADLNGLAALLRDWSDVRFLVTTLARENAHELAVLARKFANLTPFGCWWFLNTPSLIREITTMRLELLGTSFIPQHSDARVLEQLIPKWTHARRGIADALAGRYARLQEDGVSITDAQIEADVRALMSGNAERFIGAVAA